MANDMHPDAWAHVASFCADRDFCALREVVRLPSDARRRRRASAKVIELHYTQRYRQPRRCIVPYCDRYAIRHMYWLTERVYVPTLPYCLRHCTLLRLVERFNFLCVDENNQVQFLGSGTPFVLGLPPAA